MNQTQKRIVRIATAVLVGAVIMGVVGCSTGPDKRASSEPQQVVGEPPGEDSEDYQFATPPGQPGVNHGPKPGSDPSEAGSGGDPDVVDEADISRLKSFGPSIVLEHIETRPSHEGDQFEGFELIAVSDRAQQFVAPKLQVGDVITHINLVRLEKPDDYMEAWKTLEEAQEIRVDFVRNGESEAAVWRVQ